MLEEMWTNNSPNPMTSFNVNRAKNATAYQRRMFFNENRCQTNKEPSTFNITRIYPCQSVEFSSVALLKEKLEASAWEVLNLNPSLRTNFFPSCHDVGQETSVSVETSRHETFSPTSFLKITSLTGASTEHLQQICAIEQTRPFDLSLDPLVRFLIVLQPTSVHCLTVVAVLISSHLIAVDVASLDLLASEFFSYFNGRSNSATSTKYGLKQLSSTEEVRCKSVEYWRSLLGNNLHNIQLPTDHSRPAERTFLSHCISCPVGGELSSQIRDLIHSFPKETSELNAPAFFLAVFKLLVYRYSGEEDVIVVINDRDPTFSRVVGPLQRRLISRAFVQSNGTFEMLFRDIVHNTSQSLAHLLSFEELLQMFPEHDNHAPFSSLGFSYLPHCESNLGCVVDPQSDELFPLSSVAPSTSYSPLDLSFVVKDEGENYKLSITYQQVLFSEDRIEEILNQALWVLRQVVSSTETNILQYSLIPPSSVELLPNPLSDLSDTWEGSIQSIFHERAIKNPTTLAVFHEAQSITYEDLDRRSNQLANCLIASGVCHEDAVAIYGHRNIACIVAVLGTLKAGAALCMIDPVYPTSRIVSCLQVCNPRAWVQLQDAPDPSDELVSFLDSSSVSLCCNFLLPSFDDEVHPLDHYSPDYPQRAEEVGPESVAVITFTSGSTGTPKGVMGRHVSLTHFYPWMSTKFGISSTDRFSMCSGIGHDPLQRDIFTPLFFGASIHIPTQDDIFSPGGLARWMKEQKITVSCFTPAMGQLLVSIDQSENEPFLLTDLRVVFFVGACLIKKDVIRLRKLAPELMVINMYGSTETQRAVGYWEVPPTDVMESELKEVLPVGRGMKDVDLLVFNQSGCLAGIGELGEIYVRSPHLAKGYLGLDEFTNQRFIPNPFSSEAKDRLYRTGDLGRYMPDGVVECCGRADDQIKIRGFRVELGEINAHLNKNPLIRECVTIARTDTSDQGSKSIVSYVTLSCGGEEPEELDLSVVAELKDYLSAKLPRYMVPSSIVLLNSMPLTPNGKIDTGALSAPAPEPKSSAPSNAGPLVATLLEIWSELFEMTVSDVDVDFFALGGHSLMATELSLEVACRFKLPNVGISALFRVPTVNGMAETLRGMLPSEIEEELLGPQPEAPPPPPDGTNLHKEVVLNILHPHQSRPVVPLSEAKCVFLTGATGFLGAFLLHELLRATTADIYCHVRARDAQSGKDRLIENLKRHLLWDEDSSLSTRVVPVVGDLSKPLLGVGSTAFRHLANVVDVIFHNGAVVHWLRSYESLKETNVLSTHEILKLASWNRTKAVHFVSTTGVFENEYHLNKPTIYEEAPLREFRGLEGGYNQSKWVADNLVEQARGMGIPTVIYRPGYICGDSKTGCWNTDDFLCRLIKGVIQLGGAPVLDDHLTLNMAPVDYVAKLIVQIASHSRNYNKAFTLLNPSAIPYSMLFDHLESFGYALQRWDYPSWRSRLQQALADTSENALFPVASVFSEQWVESLHRPKYDMSNHLSALQGSRLQPVALDKELVLTYVSYLHAIRFLPPPLHPSPLSPLRVLSQNLQQLTRTGRN